MWLRHVILYVYLIGAKRGPGISHELFDINHTWWFFITNQIHSTNKAQNWPFKTALFVNYAANDKIPRNCKHLTIPPINSFRFDHFQVFTKLFGSFKQEKLFFERILHLWLGLLCFKNHLTLLTQKSVYFFILANLKWHCGTNFKCSNNHSTRAPTATVTTALFRARYRVYDQTNACIQRLHQKSMGVDNK